MFERKHKRHNDDRAKVAAAKECLTATIDY